jgi:hypothetical protein
MTDEGRILHIKMSTPKALRVQRGGGADTFSGRAEYSYTAQLLEREIQPLQMFTQK